MSQEVASYLADYMRQAIIEADEIEANMASYRIDDGILYVMNKQGHKFEVALKSYENNDYGVTRVLHHCANNGVHLQSLSQPLGSTTVQVPATNVFEEMEAEIPAKNKGGRPKNVTKG